MNALHERARQGLAEHRAGYQHGLNGGARPGREKSNAYYGGMAVREGGTGRTADRRPGHPQVKCRSCGKVDGMEFHCVDCCVRWLSQMTREEIQINAPVIEIVMGPAHMEQVRQAYKGRKQTWQQTK